AQLPSSVSDKATTVTAESGERAVTTTWNASNSFLAARISILLTTGTLSVCLTLADERTAVIDCAYRGAAESRKSEDARMRNAGRRVSAIPFRLLGAAD